MVQKHKLEGHVQIEKCFTDSFENNPGNTWTHLALEMSGLENYSEGQAERAWERNKNKNPGCLA